MCFILFYRHRSCIYTVYRIILSMPGECLFVFGGYLRDLVGPSSGISQTPTPVPLGANPVVFL
nr:MAG TPA: hypothetical protein [Caudoviricetes sp.]DAZ75530.1 MAG TPA: hypothetical protein [Caudoviricetes sp.]